MATRETIKASVLDDIETAVDGIVPVENVVLANGGDDAELPRVAYEVFGQTVQYNNGSSAAPSKCVLNDSGEVVDEVYDDYERLRFDIRGAASDDGTKDDVYEAIRRQFARYFQWLSFSDLHEDVRDIDLGETQNLDNTDTEPTRRVDQLSLEVEYVRETQRFDSQGTSGDPIRGVDHDIDDDGAAEYTTT